jgi:hypothetical protein
MTDSDPDNSVDLSLCYDRRNRRAPRAETNPDKRCKIVDGWPKPKQTTADMYSEDGQPIQELCPWRALEQQATPQAPKCGRCGLYHQAGRCRADGAECCQCGRGDTLLGCADQPAPTKIDGLAGRPRKRWTTGSPSLERVSRR